MAVRILIPVDNQECTVSALESVKARTWKVETKFLLVKVVEDFKGLLYTNELGHAEALQAEQEAYTYEMRMWLNELTDSFCKTFPDTTSRLEIGNVPRLIAEIAYEWCADYIVIGSHDRALSNRCALGSVASEVIAEAPCSVEAVRYKELRDLLMKEGRVTDADIKSIVCPPSRILVAVDLSPVSEIVLDWVSSIGWPAGSTVRVITVTSSQHRDERSHWFKGVGTLFTHEAQHTKTIESQFKTQVSKLTKLKLLNLETEIIRHESPAEAIVNMAQEWQAELVVTGALGEGGHHSGGRVGSTAMKVLSGLHCGMVVIQSDSVNQACFSWGN